MSSEICFCDERLGNNFDERKDEDKMRKVDRLRGIQTLWFVNYKNRFIVRKRDVIVWNVIIKSGFTTFKPTKEKYKTLSHH